MPDRPKRVEYTVDPVTKQFTTKLNGRFEKCWFDDKGELKIDDEDAVFVVNGEVVDRDDLSQRIEEIAWGEKQA